MKRILFAVVALTLTTQSAFSTGGNGSVESRLVANQVQIRITDPDGIAAWYAYNVQNNKKVQPLIAKENPANPLCAQQLTKLLAGILAQAVWVDYYDCEDTPHRESWIVKMPVDSVWREGTRMDTLSFKDLKEETVTTPVSEGTRVSDGTRWITPALQAITILLLIIVLNRLGKGRDISR